MVYNKLVRDRIPEIITSSGKTCTTRILRSDEYQKMLDKKLQEELGEYLESSSVEELADLLEVLEAAAKARGCSVEELHRIRDEKRIARGGFNNRIFLIDVTE